MVNRAEDIPQSQRLRLLTVDHEPASFASSPRYVYYVNDDLAKADSSSSTQQDLQHPCFNFSWYCPANIGPDGATQVERRKVYFKGFIPLQDPQSRSPSLAGSDRGSTPKQDDMMALHVHDPGDFAWRISFPYDFDHCLMMQWAVAHFTVS